MFLLNFSHPLTSEQIARIETILGQKVGEVLHFPAQFDPQQPFLEQLHKLLAQLPTHTGAVADRADPGQSPCAQRDY